MRARATELLLTALGPGASFRDGQLEAIEALVSRRERLLVVQRTGWGKSSVYFLATRLIREQGGGPTILISPLLALMRDQLRSAERFGVRAATINSTNTDEWDDIAEQVMRGEIDLLLVSPERLASDAFRATTLDPLLPRIGLMVVDEAHCISDWGHDFRPDYRRIRALLTGLQPGTPVLATTATASNAVVEDIAIQLGGDVRQLRGPLARDSLRLQATHIAEEAERLAWLAHYLPTIDGSGIVYVLTKAHARRAAAFLSSQGIRAEAYTGGGTPGGAEEARKQQVERDLLANELKVVIATPALSMGFDKPDLAFVIHLQMPQSLVHYYQQVGRAGRAVDSALGVLLYGDGDQRITDYFIEQAFPDPANYQRVLAALGRAGDERLSTSELAKRSGVGRALTEKIVGQLSVEVPAPVRRWAGGWVATGAQYSADLRRHAELTARRHAEYERIQQYAQGRRCYMVDIAEALDDPTASACGRCAVCCGRDLIAREVPSELVVAARDFREQAATRRRRPRKPPQTTARVKRRRRRR